jgi:hypothetical protein
MRCPLEMRYSRSGYGVAEKEIDAFVFLLRFFTFLILDLSIKVHAFFFFSPILFSTIFSLFSFFFFCTGFVRTLVFCVVSILFTSHLIKYCRIALHCMLYIFKALQDLSCERKLKIHICLKR